MEGLFALRSTATYNLLSTVWRQKLMLKFIKKYRVPLIIILILIIVAIFMSRPIRIGILFSLDSSAGYEENLAVQYYVRENPRIGLRRVKLYIENPPLATEAIKSSFHKLNNKKVSAIVGCALSFEGNIIAPLAEKYSIPVLSPTTSTSDLSYLKDNFYQYLLNTYTQGKIAADYYNTQKGEKIILLLSEQNKKYSESLANAFKKFYHGKSVKIFNDPKKPVYEKIIELKPDYVIFILPSNEIIPYINAFKKHIPKTRLVTTSWGYQQLLSVFSGPQIDGITVITMTDKQMIEPLHSKSIDFGNKYRLQSSFIFGYGYLTIHDLYKAIKNNGVSRSNIIEYMNNPRYVDSPYGNSYMTEYGDSISDSYFIFKIEGDELTLIERFPIKEYKNEKI